MTEYNSMYGTSLVSRAWHTCQICGISILCDYFRSKYFSSCLNIFILCDYFSIYQHLTKAHHVSLQDYHNQLMVNYDVDRIDWLNRCIFACKLCKEEFQFRLYTYWDHSQITYYVQWCRKCPSVGT